MAGFGHKGNPKAIKKAKANNAQVELNIAIAAYQSGQLKKAKELCTALAKGCPEDSFALGLLATIEKQLGNVTAASKLFEASINLNPKNADFHHNYAGLLQELDLKKALDHSIRAIELSTNNPIYLARLGYIQWKNGDLGKALKSSLKAIQLKPQLSSAHINLGSIYMDLGRLNEALRSTLKSIELTPENANALMNLGSIYQELGNHNQALEATLKSLEINPGNAYAHMHLGSIYKELGNLDQALEATLKSLELKPDLALAHYSLGGIKRSFNELEEARDAFKRSIELDANLIYSFYELSLEIRSAVEGEQLRERLRKIDANLLTPRKLSFLYFALSNCEHKLKNFNSATLHLAKANNAKQQVYVSDKSERIQAIRRLLSIDYGSLKSTGGEGKIFIVGMPRSGSTLLEVILSINSNTIDLGESRAMQKALKMLEQKKTPNRQANELESIYEQCISMKTAPEKILIDKQLYNFMFSGAIASHMPSAKIIHCCRNPLDNILSMQKANLRAGHNYTSSATDSAEVLIEQEKAMSRYKKLFSQSIYTFNYDNLVNSPELELKKLLAWLGWDWNNKYLSPHKNNIAINTASVLQVRQPINNKSVGGWKNYLKILEPSRRLLIESKLFDNQTLEMSHDQ